MWYMHNHTWYPPRVWLCNADDALCDICDAKCEGGHGNVSNLRKHLAKLYWWHGSQIHQKDPSPTCKDIFMLADFTLVLVFNHWFKNISVEKLGESHTTEREMLQQFDNIRISGKKTLWFMHLFYFLNVAIISVPMLVLVLDQYYPDRIDI